MTTKRTPDELAADEAALRALNDALYVALQDMDMAAMGDIWAGREHDVCVHPGWEMLSGWPSIRESWRAIFANTGFMQFSTSDVQIEVLGEVGRVSCTENIFTVAGIHTVHSQVAATNLFLRTTAGWKLVLHHGSPVATHHSVEELDLDAPTN